MSSYRRTPFWRGYTAVCEYVDHRKGWDRLPRPLGLAVLLGVRTKLRQRNLHDTQHLPSVDPPAPAPADPRRRTERTPDGSWNDLDERAAGMAGARFGRNIPLDKTADPAPQEVLSPSPREVSRRLMTRHELVAAEPVNSLVAAWLQFMIHDWFSHGKSPTDNPWVIELAEDDSWPDRPMTILRTMDDPTRHPDSSGPQTRVNVLTHWWDGSQVYGENAEAGARRRSGVDGRLTVLDDGSLPRPTEPDQDPARVPGFWVGLAMLVTLFTHEHNAICDRLKSAYPDWDDEQLFQHARLVNAALLAKIHTVEWTPAVISHPTTVTALRANWFGLAGERLQRLFGRRIRGGEVIGGIPGTHADHYGVPFSLTEEFVAVYRMHPLLRDDWTLRRLSDDRTLRECTFRDLAGPAGVDVLLETGMTDLLYSFGTQPPGLVTLHNYPRFLQEFERPDGILMDLAATDVLRSRELGVPRYNEFRRLVHLEPFTSFEELTDNPQWAREISDLYDGDIERVDLPVGMFAERRPEGFAFSDTAFRIFVLMASRRLNSDRFFTDYYTPEVYSQAGMDWIADTTMADVLLRHHPELRPALTGVDNAFARWRRTAATPEP